MPIHRRFAFALLLALGACSPPVDDTAMRALAARSQRVLAGMRDAAVKELGVSAEAYTDAVTSMDHAVIATSCVKTAGDAPCRPQAQVLLCVHSGGEFFVARSGRVTADDASDLQSSHAESVTKAELSARVLKLVSSASCTGEACAVWRDMVKDERFCTDK